MRWKGSSTAGFGIRLFFSLFFSSVFSLSFFFFFFLMKNTRKVMRWKGSSTAGFGIFFFFVFFLCLFLFFAFSCFIGNFCPPKVDDNGYKLLFQSCRVYARVVWCNFCILNSEKKEFGVFGHKMHFASFSCFSLFGVRGHPWAIQVWLFFRPLLLFLFPLWFFSIFLFFFFVFFFFLLFLVLSEIFAHQKLTTTDTNCYSKAVGCTRGLCGAIFAF